MKHHGPYLEVELVHLLIGQCEEVGTLELQHYGSDGVIDIKSRPRGLAVQMVVGAAVQLHDGSLDAQLKDFRPVGEGGLTAAGVDRALGAVLVLHPLFKSGKEIRKKVYYFH